jgi:acyl-CoA synthetase (AMP-forming)/AMP-acid ligase II
MLVQPLDALRQSVPALRGLELVATDRALDGPPTATPSPGQGGERLALLQYTSGSTATPKGVMLTHANLMANQRAIEHAFGMREDDVVISWLPLFHDMGLIGTLLSPLYQGASAVLFSPQQFMERPERWLDAVSRFRGTVSGAPDFAYRMCVNRADPAQIARLDLSQWRLAFCGAEPVRHATLRAFADTYAAAGFDRAALYPCYGLAEATLLVTGGKRGGGVHTQTFDAQALAERRVLPVEGGQPLVGCGQAQPGHAVLIAHPESGEPLPEGQIGEIWASGPSIAQGYWQNPEGTERTFARRGERVYLRTGDLGFEHGGQLFVAGREKDMIIVRGQNLYPQDIERSVEEGVSVLRKGRIAAFAVEIDGREGIGVASEVSPRVARLIEPDAVCRAISERVAQAHGESPSLILLLEAGALPITSSGKLQRSATRAAWQNGSLGIIAQYQPHAAPPVSG